MGDFFTSKRSPKVTESRTRARIFGYDFAKSYPNAKKSYPKILTDRELKGLKPESKPYKKYDGDGLFITVTPAGGKHWKYRYKFDGKESVLSLGKYPTISLYDARKLRDDCARLLLAGKKTCGLESRRQVQLNILAFDKVAREWMSRKKWTAGTRGRNERIILQDLAANLVGKEFSEITAMDLLNCIKKWKNVVHMKLLVGHAGW